MITNQSISIAVRTGNVKYGAKEAIKTTKSGEAKAIILASNCPNEVSESIKYYAELADIPVVTYEGSGWDLGAVCGKPFIVSVLSIIHEGDSDILKRIEGKIE